MILPYFLKSIENRDIIILISENQTMTCIPTRMIREQTGFKNDGFVKSSTSVLRCIPRHCGVRQVRLIPRNLRVLNLKFFPLPSNFDFLSVHQEYYRYKNTLPQEAQKLSLGNLVHVFINTITYL